MDAESIGLELDSAKGKDICRYGEMIKAAAQSQAPVQHPLINYPGAYLLLSFSCRHFSYVCVRSCCSDAVHTIEVKAGRMHVVTGGCTGGVLHLTTGPDILCFRGPATSLSGAHAKNAVVMSNGVLDW